MKTIVVLTRDEDISSVMARALGREYKVSAVKSLEDLYKGCAKKPELIIYDISPPCEKAMENCRKLKNHPLTKDVPLIAISSIPWEKDRKKVFESTGAEHVLGKPFSIAEFRGAVYSWV